MTTETAIRATRVARIPRVVAHLVAGVTHRVAAEMRVRLPTYSGTTLAILQMTTLPPRGELYPNHLRE